MKVLCVASRVPWPLEKGDKLRLYHQLEYLSRYHEVTLFALTDTAVHPDAERELRKFCKGLHIVRLSLPRRALNLVSALASSEPLQVAYFYSPEALRRVERLISELEPDVIYCQLIRTARYAGTGSGPRRVIDYMDAFSKGMERRADKASWLGRPVFRMESQRLARYEAAVSKAFDGYTVISAQDAGLLNVSEPERLAVVPNGVDTTRFSPLEHEKDHDLLFHGNMSYPPNVEAVKYLVRQVLPRIWRTRPETTLLISGATPSAEVRALRSERVTISGWLPDVRSSYARSRVLVAPMQTSIGLQNKLLEAVAMKVPCITTSLSNNALHAIPGTEILIADTPDEFALRSLELLNDPDKARRLAERAYRSLLPRYDWAACGEMLDGVLGGGTQPRAASA